MIEDYAHSALRVRLFKKGLNHTVIDDLFRNFSVNEIETAPQRLNAVFNLLNESGNQETFRMVKRLIEFLIANKDTENFCVWVTKDSSGFHNITIGEN
jgi:hypothetical protein